ncbi:MFS transporter [Dyadobacter subterraneus]|uniref:MFS transporter n=1 Tax=Dyadobacter subterraneus TaxID=2773304 RepID=A0ABR9W6V4_9BACT|nr:MFS transporter [Dyadobacter subterraneus]MBE9461177.1 MFS transporter [Dyadobacter subterraneus]
MAQPVNSSRLFNASCFALITTAFSFGIRAGILTELGEKFSLSGEQLGYINSMAFFGFPIAMIVFGALYNVVGPKRIIYVTFISHALGIVLTIYAQGFWGLLISTFFIGFGNGCTEAACNPMIADTYSGSTLNKMMNRFHMWFPGGIVVGSLISKFMTDYGFNWQAQMWVIAIPAVIYAVLFWGQTFPVSKVEANTAGNFKAMLSPLYIFIMIAMAFTAISEFGPEQWVGPILGKVGASPMIILVCVTGLMAVGRFFAGPIVHRLNPITILLGSTVMAAVGIYLMSIATGGLVYFAAMLFAVGVCYFWPTMLGFVAEYLPTTGAFGLSIVGGMGMFSTSIFQPVIGKWLDNEKAVQAAAGVTGDAAELAAGQATLQNMIMFPLVALAMFIILYFWIGNKRPVYVDQTEILKSPQL